MNRARWRGSVFAGALVAYVVASYVVLGVLLWTGLAPAQRAVLGEVAPAQWVALLIAGALAVGGLGVLVAKVLGRYAATARRLAADTRVMLGANPDHRLDSSGPPELAALAEAVNDLAERRCVAEREVAQQVEAAQASVEQERNRLAALMAELTVAVVVCNLDGRVLLYNTAARSLLEDDAEIGLGRSVFGIVDRSLVDHALERIAAGSSEAHVSTTLQGRQLLQVHVAPVHGVEGAVTGFVLVLEDLTRQLQAGARRDALLRQLIEATRASLGSIQAAIETVVDYPDMQAEERSAFIEIVRGESQRLGEQIEQWVEESSDYVGAEWLLADMRGSDLMSLVAREVEDEGTVAVSIEPLADGPWVKVDSHALARAVVHLTSRLRGDLDVEHVTLVISPAGQYAQLDAQWHGDAPDAEMFQLWLEQPLPGGVAATVREVVERHGGEIWSAEAASSTAYIRLLLPLAPTTSQSPRDARQAAARRTGPEGPPEFYDFALFDLRGESMALHDRSLSELGYTVFDTETTGMDPAGGDEVISVGAVRIVNGRVLRRETFEALVDPRRPVPAQSVAVHGITSAMLVGQPPIEEVLPLFARFAQDTVLVGHNVGFDMQFLRLKEDRAGVQLGQPVLDTLLLDAAVHPDHEAHSLEAIAERLGVEVTGRHTALGDALVTAEVFVRLIALLARQGVHTLGEALEAARVTYQARLSSAMYDR